MAKKVPSYTGTLQRHSLTLPPCISECSGIRVFGRRIKSLAFSTDVAIIKNINADAIIAVYPFTPQPVIAQAIISVSDVPVFVGWAVASPRDSAPCAWLSRRNIRGVWRGTQCAGAQRGHPAKSRRKWISRW